MAERRNTPRRALPWGQIAASGLALALGAFALTWIEGRHIAQLVPTELYILIIALGFAALGIWIGRRATAPLPDHVAQDRQATRAALGISDREAQVLACLAQGQTNKEIARSLNISPNTVKTHIARLYEKLGVSRRTQALQRASELSLID